MCGELKIVYKPTADIINNNTVLVLDSDFTLVFLLLHSIGLQYIQRITVYSTSTITILNIAYSLQHPGPNTSSPLNLYCICFVVLQIQ